MILFRSNIASNSIIGYLDLPLLTAKKYYYVNNAMKRSTPMHESVIAKNKNFNQVLQFF